jgi:hypothetical protein
MPSTMASKAAGRRRTLRNPGGATSTASTGDVDPRSEPSRTSFAARSVAISSGALRYGRASFIARLDARSPCSGLAGCSTSTVGRSSVSIGGRAPSSMARDQARSTASRTWLRSGAGITVEGPPMEGWDQGAAHRTGAGHGSSVPGYRGTGSVLACNGSGPAGR